MHADFNKIEYEGVKQLIKAPWHNIDSLQLSICMPMFNSEQLDRW